MAAKTGYERVKAARSADRPTGLDYVNYIFSDFVELHGDRRFADDAAVVGGIARLGDRPVTVIAIEKGHNTKDRMARNFGMPHPEGYRKALRLMRQAEKFHRPVICFVDTAGAYCGIGAEERGQGQAIAENLVAMSGLKTPILSVLIGEGGSGGALALAVADRVFMLENAVYSVISPEGCASILWKDAARAEEAASCLKLTAHDALAMGITEEVIPEDQLGTPGFYDDLAFKLRQALGSLEGLTVEQLLEARYQRFRSIGQP
ncbi:MAG TPA: acetyl-CoA carboxylase carboxyltransferase subunit alpha [Candidatus Avoscillospira stercoripullorum]|uniref:Acetyl-coenzyme A carboxylase carboxyl transferase subunit alpha n=1 Tax=Candidatus Avoscillospira stercoripullorum TaxID=2840709 RepID=A0A9D1AAJ6_9FIRM|nr:acetyl-CoA carboxylase carboxyltransferase subunit alpha [Candidatus Avoscillospira stercoripullorum]